MLKVGDSVLHARYGAGVVESLYDDSTVVVQWARMGVSTPATMRELSRPDGTPVLLALPILPKDWAWVEGSKGLEAYRTHFSPVGYWSEAEGWMSAEWAGCPLVPGPPWDPQVAIAARIARESAPSKKEHVPYQPPNPLDLPWKIGGHRD